MIEHVEIPAMRCTCDLCRADWISISQRVPACCPNRKCRSREWNGVKQRKPQPARAVLPKPKRVRVEDDEF